ncbi:MAG: hypothetical protein ABFS35_08225 [Bacteroidota bacterium]
MSEKENQVDKSTEEIIESYIEQNEALEKILKKIINSEINDSDVLTKENNIDKEV